ncbi:HNH endonuclease [Metabacillus indicus]|uniref:HNH endonuclease n=1 Tax=Metabacillus indicus TaxID=246786 RepID=UPI0024901F51|nr:HNH endonuclease [Metabacillus indicus]
MGFNHGLKPSDIVTHRELIELFGVSTSGGMRRSLTKNTLVLISDHTNGLYDDRWIEDVFHYTGMGQEGNQSIEYAQNKTLNHSNNLSIEVQLFEVFQSNNYIYQGEVYLAGEPYQEMQPDKNEDPRLVWVFPLKLKEGQKEVHLSINALISKEVMQEKTAKKLTDNELIEKATFVPAKPGARNIVTKVYERNATITELAKRRANGICQLCDQRAPFNTKKGEPYLEKHHIEWLSNGGEDTIDNTVALCANCHRKMHSLNLSEDVRKLQGKAQR